MTDQTLDPDDLLSSSQAAVVCGVTVDTIQQWARDGVIPAGRTGGGRYRFRRGDLPVDLGEDEAWTPGEAAAYLGITVKRVKYLSDLGDLHPIRTAGGHRRFSAREIRGFGRGETPGGARDDS